MKILFSLLVLICSSAYAQLSKKQLRELRENTAKVESSHVQLQQSLQESQRLMDTENMEAFKEQSTRNLNTFIAAQKERENKQMKRMYWRIGFGVLMLVVLVAGWLRKKK